MGYATDRLRSRFISISKQNPAFPVDLSLPAYGSPRRTIIFALPPTSAWELATGPAGQVALIQGNAVITNLTRESLRTKDYVLHVSTEHPVFEIWIQNPHVTGLYARSVNVTDLTILDTEALTTIRRFLLRDAHRRMNARFPA